MATGEDWFNKHPFVRLIALVSVLIAILVGIASLFTFITGKSNIPEYLSSNILTPTAPFPPVDKSECNSESAKNITVREAAELNEPRTFIRCPVGEVEYILQPDDVLNSVVLECDGELPKVLKFSKDESRSQEQDLPFMVVEKFSAESDCIVKITITNSVGNIGFTIWQEVVSK